MLGLIKNIVLGTLSQVNGGAGIPFISAKQTILLILNKKPAWVLVNVPKYP
jgi:hypothetical protein